MILIVGAMPEEVAALEKRMTEVTHISVGLLSLVKGKLAKVDVLLALSGVGKVNAAMTVSQILSKYTIEAVINIGSAGGLKEGQKVGDIVLGTTLQYHDFDIGPDTMTDPRFIFQSDASLQASLLELLSKEKVNHHHGLLVSGDQFITKDSPAFLNIQDKFASAIAVDMESAAIAAVAQHYSVPVIIIRSLSDVTHQEGNALDFETYLALASENSARICELFIKKEFAN